jgi:hypothetical protein
MSDCTVCLLATTSYFWLQKMAVVSWTPIPGF